MSHVPTYVYVLFLLVLWIGYQRCFTRVMRVERLLMLPTLMIVLGLRGFFSLFPQAGLIDLVGGVIGAAIGLAVGWRHASGWTIRANKPARLIEVPGDIAMMVIILGIFAFEFALHYGVESHAEWAQGAFVEPCAAAIWAWFAAMSAGRNLNLALRFRSNEVAPLTSEAAANSR